MSFFDRYLLVSVLLALALGGVFPLGDPIWWPEAFVSLAIPTLGLSLAVRPLVTHWRGVFFYLFLPVGLLFVGAFCTGVVHALYREPFDLLEAFWSGVWMTMLGPLFYGWLFLPLLLLSLLALRWAAGPPHDRDAPSEPARGS